MSECQCAGCYPEREARRKHREKMEEYYKRQEELRHKKTKPLPAKFETDSKG